MRALAYVALFVGFWAVCWFFWWVVNDWYFGPLDEISLEAHELAEVDRCVAAHPAGARWREDRDVSSARPLEPRGGAA